MKPKETLVTVRFSDHPRGTKMRFEQSGFESSGSRNGHKGGWNECFGLLAKHLASVQRAKTARSRQK